MASGASSGLANASLTDAELAQLAESLGEKKRPTVYLREAIPSLGLPEGSSARVLSINGRSLTVKPRGVDDELPFEAEEVRLTRKPPTPAPRKRAPRKAPAKAAAVKAPAVKAPAVKATAPVAVEVVAPKAPQPKAPERKAPEPKAPEPKSAVATASLAAEPKPAPVKAARARRGPASVSVTIEGTAENEWTVTVMRGAKRVGKPTAAAPDTVGRAMAALGDEAANSEVSGLLDAAREQAEQRVVELARQLEEAQRTLKSLGSGA